MSENTRGRSAFGVKVGTQEVPWKAESFNDDRFPLLGAGEMSRGWEGWGSNSEEAMNELGGAVGR